MKKPIKTDDKRQHHYLVAGEITFNLKDADGEQSVNIVKQNCVVFSAVKEITVSQLGRAQQTLQMQFFQKMGTAEGITITNVVVLGLMYLGHMTQEEFNKAPEAPKAKESVEINEILGNA